MELNYKAFGQGEPLIILHGLFGTLDNWQTIAKQLAEHFSVFIVDQRNHGRSPHLPEISYRLMAEDLQHFMEQQWVHRAHILGHSMGGKTAMQFALDYPDMVDRLVVVDIAPGANEGGHETIFSAMLDLDLTNTENRTQADEELKRRIPEYGVRQFLLKNLSRDKATGGYRWKMNLTALHKQYHEILAAVSGHEEQFDGPTLFIRGGKSDYIGSPEEQQIATMFPTAELKTVASAGHWVHAEAPKELLELVLAFLR